MPKLGIGLIIFLIIAGFLGYRYFTRGAGERVRYEAAVDAAVDRELATARLDFLREELDEHNSDRLGHLRSLYEAPGFSEAMNTAFSMLNANWIANYPRVLRAAHVRNWPDEPGRLQAEVDERLGAGVYALMSEKQQEWRAGAPERQRQREEQMRAAQAASEREMRELEAYYRRYGHLPGQQAPQRQQQGQAQRQQAQPQAAAPAGKP